MLGLMKRAPLIAGGLIAVAVAGAIAVYYPILALAADLVFLNEAAPEKDAAAALASGQPRCYSVNGYARWFPGVEGEKGRAFCQARERNFRETSDVLMGPWHMELQSRATAYAGAYNGYVVRAAVDAK